MGQIPYYIPSGFEADEGLHYNDISKTLSVRTVLLQPSFVLSNEMTVLRRGGIATI